MHLYLVLCFGGLLFQDIPEPRNDAPEPSSPEVQEEGVSDCNSSTGEEDLNDPDGTHRLKGDKTIVGETQIDTTTKSDKTKKNMWGGGGGGVSI